MQRFLNNSQLLIYLKISHLINKYYRQILNIQFRNLGVAGILIINDNTNQWLNNYSIQNKQIIKLVPKDNLDPHIKPISLLYTNSRRICPTLKLVCKKRNTSLKRRCELNPSPHTYINILTTVISYKSSYLGPLALFPFRIEKIADRFVYLLGRVGFLWFAPGMAED